MDARDGDREAQALPAGHPPVKSGRIGVLLLNLGTPDGTDYWSDAPLPQGVPLGPPRHRGAALEVVADPQPDHPDRAPGPQGQGLRQDLEQGAQRGPAQDHHPRRRPRSLAAAARRTSASWSTGPCATPIPTHGQPDRAAAAPRLRSHPARAALSAIRRGHDGHGLRQGLRRADAHALAAGRAGGAALLRRSRLYRRAGRLDRGPSRRRSTSSPRC